MEKSEFTALILDYLKGEIGGDKLKQFEQYLVNNPQSIMEVDALKSTWGRVNDSQIPEPSKEMDAKFYEMLSQSIQKKKESIPSFIEKVRAFFIPSEGFGLAHQLAYGLAVLAIGFIVGQKVDFGVNPDMQLADSALAETEKVRSDLVMALIDQPSANKRLQAVNEANKLDDVTEVVIEALFQTLNNDANVNVRLASVESLAKYAEKPIVREGLVMSIAKQDSPLVQIALADLMVLLQEKKSIDSMEKLLEKPDINNAVKDKIQKSIQDLT